MGDNRDESPLMVWVDRNRSQSSSNCTRFLQYFCFCNNTQESRSFSWKDSFKGSARNAVEESQQKCRSFFQMMKKMICRRRNRSNEAKSGRFQYDPLSYALNFDDGCQYEDEYSLRAFSARFAAPVAKPREATQDPKN